MKNRVLVLKFRAFFTQRYSCECPELFCKQKSIEYARERILEIKKNKEQNQTCHVVKFIVDLKPFILVFFADKQKIVGRK